MTIREYLEECIVLLTTSDIIGSFQITKRRESETDGYLRARAVLLDGDLFEISLYCQLVEDEVKIAGYRFHWQRKDGKLVKRWDDAKHHPELPSFPHHVHIGEHNEVKESTPVNLSEVLLLLEGEMRH